MSTENTWKSQAGFVWSLIGSAVGFANILSFSAKAYKNGGGAYLIPYVIALFVIGIPFLILEGKIGHRWKSPLVTAYGLVWGRLGKVVGWIAVLACLTIGAFYIVLTGYAAAYTWFSAASQIPENTHSFFLHNFLHITPTLQEGGKVAWPIFFATAAVGAVAWMVLRYPVRSGIEKICSFFMPLMVVMMTIFAVMVCFLPGGMQGWVYYLKPNFEKLLDFSLWRDVFGQLFFSLSLGLGIVVGYSRHTGEKMNISRAMFSVAIGDFIVSFISGVAIFGCLAHISHTQNIPFNQILTTDSTFEIGFILFPKILKIFGTPLSQVIGTLFFSCVFIAGITGVFSIVESIAGNAEVEFKTSRKKSVAVTTALLLALALFFCRGNGSHLIDALAPMVLGINMLIGGLALLFAFSESSWLRWSACLILGTILIGNLWQECHGIDLGKIVRWGWFLSACLMATYMSYWHKKKSLMVSSR
jgi:neurotransmitter:Na+ symporter, NSS family